MNHGEANSSLPSSSKLRKFLIFLVLFDIYTIFSDGKMHIDMPFSRLLGKPPIMVAGITPTTVKAGFVSAVLNSGSHIELVGGGHYNANALRKKVAEIQSKIPPGVVLTLNSLYINPRQFGFQLPLWQELRCEGVLVEGFCVAPGIPSAEKAAEIIAGLKAAGIRHVSFKPGSVEGIRRVVSIAAANPDFPRHPSVDWRSCWWSPLV
jgi:fatty acid synthase subunit alpha